MNRLGDLEGTYSAHRSFCYSSMTVVIIIMLNLKIYFGRYAQQYYIIILLWKDFELAWDSHTTRNGNPFSIAA